MAINPLQAPINYAVEVQSPFEAAIGGIKLGAGLEELQVARQKRVMEAQQQQAAQAQQAQFQSSLNRFFTKPPAERTFEELQPLLVGANKQQFDALKLVGEQMGTEKLNSSKKFTSQVLLAFEANPETAKTILQERINAETDPGQKRAFETVLEIANQDPNKAARLVESLGAATFGPEWFKAIEDARIARDRAAREPEELKRITAAANTAVTESQLKVQELRAKLEAEPDVAIQRQLATQLKEAEVEEKKALAAKAAADARVAGGTVETRIGQAKSEAEKARVEAQYAEDAAKDAIKKRAADLGLTTAQTNQALTTTRKLGLETQKAAVELAALKATGGRDPEKTFAQEEKIRKEWQGRSKMYSELQGTFNTLEASAKSENGPGDIALITGFMKMLDPGSVVRETEFATARDTAGLFTQLSNRLEKAKNGQLLDNKQRNEYIALSKKYLESAQAKAAQERKDLGIVVKNYNLNPQNVFGAETAPTQPAALPASATVGGRTYPRPASFTDAQWRDYLKANGVIQ
jgi:hypothetical protein